MDETKGGFGQARIPYDSTRTTTRGRGSFLPKYRLTSGSQTVAGFATMRRLALTIGLLCLLFLCTDAYPKKVKRSVDLNEQHKLESACLCDDLRPSSYILEIEPLLKEAKFNGRVRINVTWTESASKIRLHIHQDLQISHSNVRVTQLTEPADVSTTTQDTKSVAKVVKVAKIERNPRWLIIHLEETLRRNSTCEVDITYFGNMTRNETSGLFINEYMDVSGQKHTVVGTYLRLNNARRVFPGFDELQYKAKFQLVLTRPQNMTALSNTPIIKTTPVNGESDLVQDFFETTPKMTTYQLAFVISDFESIKPTKAVTKMDGQELEIRVWGRKDYMEALKDVPDKIVLIVNYLQDYFNSSIKLPKLDVIAMPMYTASKASDNWGLMIFKESELSSPLVWNTAYELTYQWIGQYVTPYRWMDASENKGLNSFLASMATLDINPNELKGKWPMNILYSLYYGYGKAFRHNRGTGIIRDAKFAKIELVFRMFHYIFGKDNFRTAMRHFIERQAHSSVIIDDSSVRDIRTFTAKDIYDSLNDVVTTLKVLPNGLKISDIADTWVDHERLPLVTAIRNYNNKTITLSQKPYERETRKSTNSWENAYQWYIPIVMQSRNQWNISDFSPKVWMVTGEKKKDLNIPDIDNKDAFVIINPEEVGLFPVNYDEENWKLLVEYLKSDNFETIPTLTRAKLLHDSWNLAYANELCFGVAMAMTRFLTHEKSHVVWEPFFTMFDHIGTRIEGSKQVFTNFETYARNLLEPMYTEPCENAQANEPSWKTHLRGLARYFLCRVGYEPCINEAREQFKKWMTDNEPDKGNPVANEFICPVFKWGTDEEWEFGLNRVINFPKNSLERKQSERTYLLKTLAGCPKSSNKILRLLNMAIIDQKGNFSDADIHLIFTMLTGSAPGYTTLYQFLNENWDTIKQRFETKKTLWTEIIQSATSYFTTKEGLQMTKELYEKHQEEIHKADTKIQQAIQNIEQESQWTEKNLPIIDEWLQLFQTKNEGKSQMNPEIVDYWKKTLECPNRTTPPSS